MLPKFVIFIFIELTLICVVSNVKQPVVETPLGEVSGYFMKTRGGRQISAFTSIPYAVPPLGELRFKVIDLFTLINEPYILRIIKLNLYLHSQ